MAAMPVVLTWTRPQTVTQKGLPIWCYSAEEVQAWNFLQLNYHTSWYIKTPMPVSLSWTLAQTVAKNCLLLVQLPSRNQSTSGNARCSYAANARVLHGKGVGSSLINGVLITSSGRLGGGEGPATIDTSKIKLYWEGPNRPDRRQTVFLAAMPTISQNVCRRWGWGKFAPTLFLHAKREWERKIWATAIGELIRKAKKEETRQNKKRIETDNNVEPPRAVTETKQKQPFDTSLKQVKEKIWEVLMSTETRWERWHHMVGRRRKWNSGDPL